MKVHTARLKSMRDRQDFRCSLPSHPFQLVLVPEQWKECVNFPEASRLCGISRCIQKCTIQAIQQCSYNNLLVYLPNLRLSRARMGIIFLVNKQGESTAMGSWQDVYLIPSQILTRRGMLNTRYLLISFIYPKLETTYFNDSFNPYSFLVRFQPKVTFEADFHYPVASDKGAITWALRDISRYLPSGGVF